MILQRLVAYYDRLAADPANAEMLAKPGYSLQKISYCVVLEPDGTLRRIQSLLDSVGKRSIPRQLLVPGQAKPSGSGINPCFLWDNAAYLLGFKLDDPAPQRTRDSFEAFRQRHLEVEAEVDCAEFSAVCSFLRNWSPEAGLQWMLECADSLGSFGVFRLAGNEQRFVHETPRILQYLESQPSGDAEAVNRSVCLVTGKEAPIARLHEPKIKGVYGAQSAGALLVSFNDDAYKSFGKDQSYNAPVSTTATFKYANALNYLLATDERRSSVGDSTVIFWSERKHPLEDFASDLFSGFETISDDATPEDRKRVEQLRLLISQLRQGLACGEAVDPDDRTGFYVLGLAPNASRISVRFWIDSNVAEMKQRLAQHLSDVELDGAREGGPPLTIRRMVRVAGRAVVDSKGHVKSYDADAVPPLLSGALARAVFTGGPYPQLLFSALINRIRADGIVSHDRVAAIKACIVRNSRLKIKPQEAPVALDIERSDPPYLTGRLFALLEKIQSDSVDGTLNATIKDRYFSSASATPALVFPRLLRLCQHHLAKLEHGRTFYEIQLGEVMGKLSSFPRHLNLEEQGLFTIGYFHQRQDLFTSKKSKQGAAE